MDDPATRLVAQKIIELRQRGLRGDTLQVMTLEVETKRRIPNCGRRHRASGTTPSEQSPRPHEAGPACATPLAEALFHLVRIVLSPLVLRRTIIVGTKEYCAPEVPSRMVRSNIRYPAPREDWAQLITAPKATPKRCGGRRCELLSKQPSALPHRTRDHSFQSPVKIDSAIAEPPNRTRTLISVLGGFVLFSERTGHVFDRPWMTGR